MSIKSLRSLEICHPTTKVPNGHGKILAKEGDFILNHFWPLRSNRNFGRAIRASFQNPSNGKEFRGERILT